MYPICLVQAIWEPESSWQRVCTDRLIGPSPRADTVISVLTWGAHVSVSCLVESLALKALRDSCTKTEFQAPTWSVDHRGSKGLLHLLGIELNLLSV